MQYIAPNFDRITFDEQLMIGQACIRRMAITVSMIVSLVAYGVVVEDILKAYPSLEMEDIQQALQYAAWLAGKRAYPYRN